MRIAFIAIGAVSMLASTCACATTFEWTGGKPTFEWVNGQVTSITAQLPTFTVFIVDNKSVRFCDPHTGTDYKVSADDIHYDLLKTALGNGKSVQVGVQNFGNDPQAGDVKRCIDRVILTH
jgi:hypothetical protein